MCRWRVNIQTALTEPQGKLKKRVSGEALRTSRGKLASTH